MSPKSNGEWRKQAISVLWKAGFGVFVFLLVYFVNDIRGGISENSGKIDELLDTLQTRFYRLDTCMSRSIHIDTSLQGQIVRLGRVVDSNTARIGRLERTCEP